MRTKKSGCVSRATATLALAAATVLGGTLLTAVPAQAQQEAAAQTVFCPYRVTVDVANVRAGAGTNHTVKYHLYRNNEILATQSMTNSFRMIRAGEWIAASNLSLTGGNCLTT